MNTSRGMTLIEVVVWVGVTILLLAAIVSSILYFYRTNSYAVEQAAAVTSAQRGISTMIGEMREATYSSNGAYPIVSMAEDEFIFYADIDEDPYIERLRYYIDAGSIYRSVIDPTGDPPSYANPETSSSISDFVRNVDQGVPAFRYYDAQGEPMTDLTDITAVRFIESTIVVNINPNRMPNQFTLRSTSAFRNIR